MKESDGRFLSVFAENHDRKAGELHNFLDRLTTINPIPDKTEVMSYVKIVPSSIIFSNPFNNNRMPIIINMILNGLLIVLPRF